MTQKLTIRNALEMITFQIGPEKVDFVGHKDFACHASPVLKAAFGPNSGVKESTTNIFKIPDTTPAAFNLWLQWTYQPYVVSRTFGIYTTLLNSQAASVADLLVEFEENMKTFIGLWGLAQYLMMPALQNHTMKSIAQLLQIVWHA